MLKYLVPNAITAASIAFGVLAIHAAIASDSRTACWWVLYCVLSDKLDGIAARALKASSEFGMQMDSLADLVSFGVAPAAIVYGFFTTHPEAGWATGWPRLALPAISVGYVVCTAVRLARFNVIADAPGAERIFFGIPSTFAGGATAAVLATLIKYGDPRWGGATDGDWRIFGAARLDQAMVIVPWMLVATGVAMVSGLRVPKVGRTTGWRVTDAILIASALGCYACGFARRVPEYLAASALTYFLFSVGFHALSPTARAVKPPALFKRAAL